MKNALISLALFVASVGANATVINPDTFTQVAIMRTIQMDKMYSKFVDQAVVTVNVPAKKATLFLGSSRADQGTTIELPIVTVTQNRCGARIYIARRNMMPVDGALQELTITDNTTSHCMHAQPMAARWIGPTQVTYKEQFYSRMGPAMTTLESYFAGEALHSKFAR